MSQYIGNDPQGNLPVRNIIATNKNYIINPTFIINQRVFAGGALVNSYGWDRWRGNVSGNMTLSGDTISIVTGNLRYVVEDFGYSGQATLSWEGDSLCAIGRLVDGQETISTPTSSPIVFNYPASTSGNEVQLNFQGNGTSFSKPKLEIGSTQTPFEYPEFGSELLKCQRYYEKTYSYSVAPGTATHDGSTLELTARNSATATPGFKFIVEKRVVPTCTPYASATGTINTCTNLTDKAAAAVGVSTHGFRYLSVTGGVTTSNTDYQMTVDAEL